MDVLSDVLNGLRLRGDLYFTTEMVGDWGVRLPADPHAIRFHLVAEGQCWVAVDGEDGAPTQLREGEFVLIPHGAGQRLLGSPRARATPLEAIVGGENPSSDGVLRHRVPGPGAPCRLVCGFCHFDHDIDHPLFGGLPPLLVLDAETAGQLPWLSDAIRLTTLEAGRSDPGVHAILGRLIEILFMQAIRSQAGAPAGPGISFMRAIADPHLAPALQGIHEAPGGDWTLAALAQRAGMSRTQFARRFKEMTGRTPIGYLISWRLATARRLLRDTDLPVAEIGARSGYRSVPSFTRSFKERFDITPAAYRRRGEAGDPGTGEAIS